MNLLRKISNLKILGLLLALYVYMAGFVMPNLMALGEATKGPLDLLFSYSADTTYAHLDSYSEAGRTSYAHLSLTIDTLYPIVYTGLFMVIIMMLARSIWPLRLKLHRLALVPLFAFVFDLSENFFIRKLLDAYPERLDSTAGYASLFSSLKWSSVGISFAIVFVFILLAARKKIKNLKG